MYGNHRRRRPCVLTDPPLVTARSADGPREPAVEISHLRKTYGPLVAVDDVSFAVAEGEIFGVLGPNGAGKTTTVECAIGLRTPDAGTVRLLGLDPQTDRDEVHEIVGVQLQTSALPDKLRVGEILDMYRSFYRDPADVGELIEALGLAGKRGAYYKSLSGGQKQRLSVALALIGRPQIAVLDEMTTGLDPAGPPRGLGTDRGCPRPRRTILLVTHFMEEAERLCDRVALIDNGRVVALGTPAEPGRTGPRRQDRAVRAVGPVRRPAADRPPRGDPGRARRASTWSSPGPASSSTRCILTPGRGRA